MADPNNPPAAIPSPLEQEVLEEYALLLANLNKVRFLHFLAGWLLLLFASRHLFSC